jgi:hypothetical protein
VKERAYAEGTSVTVESSRAEIDRILAKHGATQRGVVCDDDKGRAAVMFVLHERAYRLEIPLPTLEAMMPSCVAAQPRGWYGFSTDKRKAWCRMQLDQKCRERWRAVVLLLKAKLELVRLGVSTIEREFLDALVLPGGETLGRRIEAQIANVLQGETPRLLPEHAS